MKNLDHAYLPPLSSRCLKSKMILNTSSIPGGISRIEDSNLPREPQRRTGTREKHRTLSIRAEEEKEGREQ
jgi:hypothetical protein